MNLKDLIFIVAIAFCISWGFEYFFMRSTLVTCPPIEHSGQSFTAQKTTQAVKPLLTDVLFADSKRTTPTRITTVETDYAIYEFSTEGATLERLRFKRQLGNEMGTIATIFPSGDNDRENRCFLVALADNTPFFYTLVKRLDTQDTIVLVYEAEITDVAINKTFTLY